MRLLKYLLFFLLLIFALAIYASYELTREIEYYKGVLEKQDNIIRQHKKRMIELIQKLEQKENERFQITEQKAKVHNS
jgi:predicted Holliday junction resolvase-like endonuclease